MASMGLECLPQEILVRIACSGSAESVLALAKTCRALYLACYDTLVFKATIESRRSLWNDLRMLDVPTLSRFIGPTDTQAWARFALADQRAMELRDRLRLIDEMALTQNKIYFEHFKVWVPHLFVARYPFMRMPWYSVLLTRKFQPRVFLESPQGIFCAVASLLCTPANEIYNVEKGWILDRATADLRSISATMRALCHFVVVLKGAISTGDVNLHPHQWISTPIEPPSALDIPMHPIDATYELPIPFSLGTTGPGSWEEWLSRHTEKMSHPDQLEKAQWCGYYGYTGALAFDPPMLSIQFTVDQSRDTGARAIWKIHAQGHDGIGAFSLEGNISRKGELILRKTYIGAHSFDWKCFMTPFGIFGSWGTIYGNHFRYYGRVWLWKREWSDMSHSSS